MGPGSFKTSKPVPPDPDDICPATGERHRVNWSSVYTEGDGGDLYLDVSCADCGRSGCVGNTDMLSGSTTWGSCGECSMRPHTDLQKAALCGLTDLLSVERDVDSDAVARTIRELHTSLKESGVDVSDYNADVARITSLLME